jgi:tRNA-Thr(GGU) m(6)t(6)A37 methyltransferase TsaA
MPELRPIGVVRSTLLSPADAPMQSFEGAPEAWLEIDRAYADALKGVAPGDQIVILTWLHEADRDVLQVHPRDDRSRPLAGVFATRSQDRPNPIGLHRATVLELTPGLEIRVDALEAIDGTPVVDIKPVLAASADF